MILAFLSSTLGLLVSVLLPSAHADWGYSLEELRSGDIPKYPGELSRDADNLQGVLSGVEQACSYAELHYWEVVRDLDPAERRAAATKRLSEINDDEAALKKLSVISDKMYAKMSEVFIVPGHRSYKTMCANLLSNLEYGIKEYGKLRFHDETARFLDTKVVNPRGLWGEDSLSIRTLEGLEDRVNQECAKPYFKKNNSAYFQSEFASRIGSFAKMAAARLESILGSKVCYGDIAQEQYDLVKLRLIREKQALLALEAKAAEKQAEDSRKFVPPVQPEVGALPKSDEKPITPAR